MSFSPDTAQRAPQHVVEPLALARSPYRALRSAQDRHEHPRIDLGTLEHPDSTWVSPKNDLGALERPKLTRVSLRSTQMPDFAQKTPKKF